MTLDNKRYLCSSQQTYSAFWEDEDEAVLFLNNTGETILVSMLSIIIIDALENKPHSLQQLLDYTSKQICDDENIEEQELSIAVKSCIGQLQQLGIIKTCRI